MKDTLKVKADQMYELYLQIKKDFKRESDLMVHFASLSTITKDKPYDASMIQRTKAHIKNNTGMFSSYRGSSMFLLSFLLSSEYENPLEKFSVMLEQHDKLKAHGFKESSYIALANYSLLLTCDEYAVESRIQRAYEIYLEMKSNHPWLTSGDDYPLAMLLASSEKPLSTLMKNIEDIYTNLNHNGFSKSNGLQFLSHLLSFGDESLHTKIERCVTIRDTLKESKYRLSSTHYSSLGLITLISKNNIDVVKDVIDTADYLHSIKKYKWLGKEMLVLLSTGLVCSDQIKSLSNDGMLISTALGISLEAVIAAQSAAAIASCTAIYAASSASS